MTASALCDIALFHIKDRRVDRKTVLRESDPPRPQVRLDAFMLNPVEAIAVEQLLKGSALRCPELCLRKDPVDDVLNTSGRDRFWLPRRNVPAPSGHSSTACVDPFAEARARSGSSSVRDEGPLAREQLSERPVLIDAKLIDDRIHRKRYAVFRAALLRAHDVLQTGLGFALPRGMEQKSHSAAGHSAEHPEPPEILPEFRCTRAMMDSV